MSINLTGITAFAIPIKFGGGVEYKFTPDMALTARMAFGPLIVAAGVGAGVGFAFDTLIGMEFKI